MIFVTVGTHHQPFDRLVAAAEELATVERVVVQRGSSSLEPAGCEVHGTFEAERFAALLAEARLVVCHAGPATIEEVVASGTLPIVVPRRRLWREHVDDHQLHWARRIADRVHVVENPSQLLDAVREHEAVVEGLPRPWVAGTSERWVEALDAVSKRLVRR